MTSAKNRHQRLERKRARRSARLASTSTSGRQARKDELTRQGVEKHEAFYEKLSEFAKVARVRLRAEHLARRDLRELNYYDDYYPHPVCHGIEAPREARSLARELTEWEKGGVVKRRNERMGPGRAQLRSVGFGRRGPNPPMLATARNVRRRAITPPKVTIGTPDEEPAATP